MRTVQTMPPATRPRARSSQYDRFFDGRIWEIEVKDFPHTSLATLRATIIRRAQRKGWVVHTSLRHNPDRLFIKCSKGPLTPDKEIHGQEVTEKV